MPLSIFIDALPYSEIVENYQKWFSDIQISELQPNIGYSSSLHWQLYCDKYPDDRFKFTDWGKVPEKNKYICGIAKALSAIDKGGIISILIKKGLDRCVFRRNAFANIPFKFRKDFSEIGEYLFWNKDVYSKEQVFQGYEMISQDEGHISFELAISKLEAAIEGKKKNIMFVTGFADEIGHKVRRGAIYSAKLLPYMNKMHYIIEKYKQKYPDEDILLVSDHGMSTIKKRIELGLEKRFGKQSEKNYIAYCDSCIMCIWSDNTVLLQQIENYLLSREEGHLLSEEERLYYRVTNDRFGNLIYILKEGNCFNNSWFGKSLRKNNNGEGMHGFWPEKEAKDQMACIILISKHHNLETHYTYKKANKLINVIMQGEK